MEKEITREIVVELFRKYCASCKGHDCCVGGELNLFKWEAERLHLSKKAGTVGFKEGCGFCKEDGCRLQMDEKPLDCISYPVYPIVGDEKQVMGLIVHKSCPAHHEVSRDKELLLSVKGFWESELQNIPAGAMAGWIDDTEDYWQATNTVKIPVKCL